MAQMKLAQVTLHDQTFTIRDGNRWDIGIVDEVYHAYYWADLPIESFRTALDVGAHIGAWTRYLHARNPQIEIVAVEADADNATLLMENCNPDEYPHIHPYSAALVYPQNGQHYKVVKSAELSNTGGHNVTPCDDGETSNLMTITVQQIIEAYQWERIDVVKLDCESCEYQFVIHAPLDKIGYIVGEYHGSFDRFRSEIQTRLIDAGFTVQAKPHPADTLGYFFAFRQTEGKLMV